VEPLPLRYMPDMSTIERYGFKKSKLTIGMRFIKESIGIGVQLLPLHELRAQRG